MPIVGPVIFCLRISSEFLRQDSLANHLHTCSWLHLPVYLTLISREHLNICEHPLCLLCLCLLSAPCPLGQGRDIVFSVYGSKLCPLPLPSFMSASVFYNPKALGFFSNILKLLLSVAPQTHSITGNLSEIQTRKLFFRRTNSESAS